jgi:FAD/FMN-containing dehydrogenase
MRNILNMDSLPIIWRNDDTAIYEQARIGRIFNHRRPKRYPRAVVKATCTQHIVDAIKLATNLDCRVSVRSGGHSWAAWSVREDAVLIDLGQYQHISLNESNGIVEVSPSTTGRMLNSHLSDRGYMFCGGHCPDVGLGGFLLQGGMGWNCKVCTLTNDRNFVRRFSLTAY